MSDVVSLSPLPSITATHLSNPNPSWVIDRTFPRPRWRVVATHLPHHLFRLPRPYSCLELLLTSKGRESLTDKVSSAAKPDSEKSYVEQASDFVKGKLDA